MPHSVGTCQEVLELSRQLLAVLGQRSSLRRLPLPASIRAVEGREPARRRRQQSETVLVASRLLACGSRDLLGAGRQASTICKRRTACGKLAQLLVPAQIVDRH